VIPLGKKITRWHPKFKLNEVPEIEMAEIPKAPETGSISASTAKEVIARAQNIMEAANPRMQKALQELMMKSAGMSAASPSSSTATSSSISTPAANVADKHAATKAAILKAQQALMRNANPKMREALNKVLLKNNKEPISVAVSAAVSDQNPSTSATPAPGANEKGNPFNKKSLAALKGVSQNLIDKVSLK
jgi:chromatin licensing and DNA replication factor 1